MRSKTPILPANSLNYFKFSFQVSPPFTYGPGVQPILMTCSEPPAGTLAVVSGWGTTTPGGSFASQLQAVEVFIIQHEECNAAYANYSLITVNMICAVGPDGSKGPCEGDSGGPLVANGELVGIVSWTLSCALDGYPGFYSNIATLWSFITEQTGVRCNQMSHRAHDSFKIT